ncbi:MAG: aldolase catalytic domain-containing protein [bacterium]
MIIINTNVKILDCTIRDGGYITNWEFDKKMVKDVYDASSKAGIDFFEVGYLNNSDSDLPIWKRSSSEDIKAIKDGVDGAKIAVMIDFKKIDEINIPEHSNSEFDMIRVALHKNQISESVKYLKKIKNSNYIVSVQAMGITSYNVNDFQELFNAFGNANFIDYLYIADSYGSIVPQKIKELVIKFKENINCNIGFHSHNNMQMGLANTLAAIEAGVDIVDGTLYGMGRGAGNLPLESLVAYLAKEVKDKFNILPLLEIIDRHFVQLKEDYNWGYNLPYLLSGVYECHPYYTKKLVDYREFTIEDILKTVRKINNIDPIGFSEELLNKFMTDGYINVKDSANDFSISMLNSKNENISEDNNLINYKNRHIGRDFLILANGPNLKKYNKKIHSFIEKHNPIVMGPNYLDDLFIPDYHAFSNKRRFLQYIDTVDEKSALLIGNSIEKSVIKEKINRDYEIMQYINSSSNDFDIINGIITSNCRTVSILLIAIAIVMGAKRIFVAGMDGYLNYDSSYHFYKEEEARKNELIKEKHALIYKYLKQIDLYLKNNNKHSFYIITPTSYEKFYKGINNYL